MVPLQKVKDIILKYDTLEKELSSGNIESKSFAQKSKEYSSLKEIINAAREYLNFDDEKKVLKKFLMINQMTTKLSKWLKKTCSKLK